MTVTNPNTTKLVVRVSFMVGQLTLRSSTRESKKYSFKSEKRLKIPLLLTSVLSLLIFIPNYERKMAGQEGFEPPASGFGDRRSTVRATDLLYENYLVSL